MKTPLSSIARRGAGLALGLWLLAATAVQGETKVFPGSAAGTPGFSSIVPVHLETDTQVSGVQFDLVYNKDHLVKCDVLAGPTLSSQLIETRQLSPGIQRVLIYTRDHTWITNGSVAIFQLALAANAPAGIETLRLTNIVVASAAGSRVVAEVPGLGTIAVFSGDLFHDTEDLAWLLGGDPTAKNIVISATGMGTNLILFAGPIAGANPTWNTLTATNGRFQVAAIFQDAAGQTTKQYLREIAINNAVSWHSGWITNDQTWASNVTHVVESTAIVASNVRVTVAPGAIVKFVRGATIQINNGARFTALGATGQKIVFTSIADDSVGGDVQFDSNNSQPQPGDWPGLQLQAAGQLDLNDFVEFRYVVTTHKGTLTQNEIWDGTQLHRILDDVTVPRDVTLTILPGAIVKFEPAKRLSVSAGGHLLAHGNVAQPITFTSIRDDVPGGDTNLDGDQTKPSPGDWGSLFANGGQIALEHARILYAAFNSSTWYERGAVRTSAGATVSLVNSLISDAFGEAIMAYQGGTIAVTNSVIANADRGINYDGSAKVYLINCTLYGCRIALWGHGGSVTAYNTIISHSLENGVRHILGSTLDMRYCDVWSPYGVNFVQLPSQIGLQGNISVDPRYRDVGRLNFRLDYGSPCIDAADGTLGSETDFMGVPRYSDPHSAHTGVPAANGAYPDIGAYEFAEGAPSDVDLVITEVTGPLNATAGDLVHLEWVVANVGNGGMTGPWHDAVYLFDPIGNVRIAAGEFLVGQGIALGSGQKYTASADVRVPGGVVQNYRWQVTANSQGDIFEGANRTNNDGASFATIALDLPELLINGTALSSRFEAPDEPRWFKFEPGTNQDIMVTLDLSASSGITELYVAKGYMPSPQAFDFRQREWHSPDASTLTANADTNVYYVLAYPRSLAGAANFTIRAAVVDFMVEKVTPTTVGNTDLATLEILGANLRKGTVFSLQDTNGQRWVAQRTTFVDSSRVYATFYLSNFPAGKAHVVADQTQLVSPPDKVGNPAPPPGILIVASNLLQVASGGSGNFYAYLTGPSLMRLGRTGTWYLTYGNKGLVDVPLPLLRVTVPNAQEIKLFDNTLNWTPAFVLLAVNDRSLLPHLGPGQEITISFVVRPGPGSSVEARVEVFPGDKAAASMSPINWNQLAAPAGVDPAVWQAELNRLGLRLGMTFGEYYALLVRDLDALAQDYLGYSYVANADGQWLFGHEPMGESVERPLIEVERNAEPPVQRIHALAAKPGDGIRKTYVVMVMNSNYHVRDASLKKNLNGVLKDRQDMKQYLNQDLRVPDDQIVDLLDSTDTNTPTMSRDLVLNSIKGLKNKMDGDDNLVIVYSGHGGRGADGQGYMWLNDGEVNGADLQSAIEEAGPGTAYLVNDSCHSEALQSNVNPKNTKFVGFSATAADRISYDTASGGAFLSRFKKNMRDCNGLQKAFEKAQQDVINEYKTKTNVVKQQSPVMRNDGKVDVNGKPWKDPTGFGQRLRNFLSGLIGYSAADRITTWLVGSFDPNDKIGPTGSGAAGYIGLRQVLPYTIYFENKSTAQAPAQEVLVIDQLDPNLDWSTFELKTVAFNDVIITVPAKLQQYNTTTHVGTDTNLVKVTVRFDPVTGHVTWLLQSQDASGNLPEDPFAGFLPPNDASHRGEGSLSFLIKAKTNLVTGVTIANQARIIFDPTYGLNQPIDTPVVANTIDSVPPTSQVLALAEQSTRKFNVSWSGADDANGSGIYTYDIYVARNQDAFAPWLTGTIATTALFEGDMGATYRFYTVARDFAGNVETAPTLADTQTRVIISAPELKAVMGDHTLQVRIDNLIVGKQYAIERSSTLQSQDWRTVQEFNATTATSQQDIPLQTGWSMMFFRVRQVD